MEISDIYKKIDDVVVQADSTNFPSQLLRQYPNFRPNVYFNVVGVAGLTSLVLFKSTSRTARVALTTFGLGFGIGESFRFTSTQFQNEKSRKQ